MPIYEFYCPDCHTVFSFFSATITTAAHPDCPRCRRPRLERRPSSFAALRGTRGGRAGDETGDDEGSAIPGLDDDRLESAMDSLAGEMGNLSESDAEDPRQIARFFRRFSEVSGLEPGPKLVEMLQRLDSGADPDSLENEFGGEGEEGNEDLSEFFRLKKNLQSGRARKPLIDDTLYFL